MDITQIGTSLAIIVICYLIGLGAKTVPSIKDNLIPVIVGVSGGILGAVGMYVMPEFPASDIMTAIAVGIVSGLANFELDNLIRMVLKDFVCDVLVRNLCPVKHRLISFVVPPQISYG